MVSKLHQTNRTSDCAHDSDKRIPEVENINEGEQSKIQKQMRKLSENYCIYKRMCAGKQNIAKIIVLYW